MRYSHITEFTRLRDYDFEQLPKGEMFALSINPYTGYVSMGLDKHASSTRISYEVLKEVMHACELLERGGSIDPVADYIRLNESGELVSHLVKAAKAEYKAIRGRSVDDGEGRAARYRESEKAS